VSSTPTKTLSTTTSAKPGPANHECVLPVQEYDLEATLTSGQTFNWEWSADGWTGVVCGRWVRLQQEGSLIRARTSEPQRTWDWLEEYLQVKVNLNEVLASFPNDPHLQLAVAACRGLRLLRQEPWECLASFLLSSTKQIVQIRQIVAMLSSTFGRQLSALGGRPAFGFPSADRLAAVREAELRACKMGFRAPYLLATARLIADGHCDLESLRNLPLAEARERLMELPGVGGKIADCVLLFAFGFPEAFPVDVWVTKVLSRFYFRGRRVKPSRLRSFIEMHFGPNAGYAQQYLFHYIRTQTRGEQ